MTAMVHEPEMQEDELLAGFLALDSPEGYRAQLIDGEIVVTPPPGGPHELCISKIARRILRHSPNEFDFSGHKGLIVPSTGKRPQSHVIPDGTFALAELDLFRDAEPWMTVEPDGIAMVAEVTSSRPELDRTAKRHGYARAGIPLYLLVDRGEKRTTLFSEPLGDDYKHSERVPFGETLALPKPFDIDLDTSEFA